MSRRSFIFLILDFHQTFWANTSKTFYTHISHLKHLYNTCKFPAIIGLRRLLKKVNGDEDALRVISLAETVAPFHLAAGETIPTLQNMYFYLFVCLFCLFKK